MNILIDTAIFSLQQQGGISRLWRSLLPELQRAMPDATFTSKLPPDVFLSTYYRPAPIGVKSVSLCYDLITMRMPELRTRADVSDIRRAVTDATAVVSISQTTARDVKRILDRDSTVAYCGVDEQFGKVKPSVVTEFQKFVGKPYVMLVGKRGGYKNAQALYQAWRLWGAASQHRLLVVGGEDALPQDVAFQSRYGDTWLQMRLEDDDLQIAYAGATALVYPSLVEGFGLPIVEAMACACPVVVDHSANEVAGNAGFYCDVTRPKQIAEALNATLDMSLRMDMVMRGIAQSKRFRWAAMAETMASVIRRVVA